MSAVVGYALWSLLLVSGATGALVAVLGPGQELGVVVAAAVAYPVMVVSFAVMVRFRGAGNRFLAAWIGGVLVRLLVLGTVVAAVMAVEALEPAATLLALAGFFFGLLLLEPVFFRKAAGG